MLKVYFYEIPFPGVGHDSVAFTFNLTVFTEKLHVVCILRETYTGLETDFSLFPSCRLLYPFERIEN